jgi:hypothetical protein
MGKNLREGPLAIYVDMTWIQREIIWEREYHGNDQQVTDGLRHHYIEKTLKRQNEDKTIALEIRKEMETRNNAGVTLEEFLQYARIAVHKQLWDWNPGNRGWTKRIKRELDNDEDDEFIALLHNGKIDYELYHTNRPKWDEEGFKSRWVDEEFMQFKGPTRALANVHAALDIKRSHAKSVRRQLEQLPSGSDTLHSNFSRLHLEQGVGIVNPELRTRLERAARKIEVLEDCSGMVSSEEEPDGYKKFRRDKLALRTQGPPREESRDLETRSKKREGSVTDQPQEESDTLRDSFNGSERSWDDLALEDSDQWLGDDEED